MRLLFLLVLAVSATQCQEFFHHANNHPAAGPDLSGHFARTLLENELFAENEAETPDALVDPDGRKFIVPLKTNSVQIEYNRLKEKAEIAKILEEADKPSVSISTWLWAMLGCSLVISCGIVPAYLLPPNTTEYLHTQEGKRKLNLMLSFAVGSLLGDVFLHLLPETWSIYNVDMHQIGLWTLAGLLVCFFVEKICASTEESQHRICALMNLVANIIDNFTHGLAVGASFLVSTRCGILTTFAILVHEIPHEISDFAILLRADFNRADAIKAQLLTATGGVLGACVALFMHGETFTGSSWVLPFTAGGFINIALAQILPELNEETDNRQSFKQLFFVVIGAATMAILNQIYF